MQKAKRLMKNTRELRHRKREHTWTEQPKYFISLHMLYWSGNLRVDDSKSTEWNPRLTLWYCERDTKIKMLNQGMQLKLKHSGVKIKLCNRNVADVGYWCRCIFFYIFRRALKRGKGSRARNSIPVKVNTYQAISAGTSTYGPPILKSDRKDEKKVV